MKQKQCLLSRKADCKDHVNFFALYPVTYYLVTYKTEGTKQNKTEQKKITKDAKFSILSVGG